jgi:nucleotidyltransferase/DNA polymerase involved in DNA repair
MKDQMVFVVVRIYEFPAQVMSIQKANLIGLPFVVIQQSQNGHKTMAYSVSLAAHHLGIYPGMPIARIQKQCPKIPVILRDEKLEQLASEALNHLWVQYTPDFRMEKNGTVTLNMTGTPLLRSYEYQGLCDFLKKQMATTIGFHYVTIGLAGTPLVAKVLANTLRPEGISICPPGREAEILSNISTEYLPGLSSLARETIKKYAIGTIGQLLNLGRENLIHHFGKEGEKIYSLVSGLELNQLQKEVSDIHVASVLPHDINDMAILQKILRQLVDELLFKLRHKAMQTNRFILEIKYTDHKSSRRSFSMPQSSPIFLPLYEQTLKIFLILNTRRTAIASLHLMARQPSADSRQLDLFTAPIHQKQMAIGYALDKIRLRYHFSTLKNGSTLDL